MAQPAPEARHEFNAPSDNLTKPQNDNFSDLWTMGQMGSAGFTMRTHQDRADASDAMVKAGLLGDMQLAGFGDDLLGINRDQKLLDDFDAIAKKVGAPELSVADKLAIVTLPSDQKEMYRHMLDSLTKLSNKEINSGEYMAEGLRNAARLAEKNEGSWWNPLGSSKETLFVDYVGLAFSDKSLGLGNIFRTGAGSSFDRAGAALERTFNKIVGAETGKGFNPNIVDSQNPENNVQHHFRELLMVGYNRGRTIGNWATTKVDDPKVNPGDVKNGYFGTMIGSALRNEKITPSEAAELTIWAYTAHGGKQPPWNEPEAKGNGLSPDDYFLNPWLKAFRDRNK